MKTLALMPCLLLLSGCGGAPAAAPPAATVSFSPAPPVARRDLTLCARPLQPGALRSARVFMPGMPMGATASVALAPDGRGAYCGPVLFVMGGRWDVALAGAGPGTLQVEVAE